MIRSPIHDRVWAWILAQAHSAAAQVRPFGLQRRQLGKMMVTQGHQVVSQHAASLFRTFWLDAALVLVHCDCCPAPKTSQDEQHQQQQKQLTVSRLGTSAVDVTDLQAQLEQLHPYVAAVAGQHIRANPSSSPNPTGFGLTNKPARETADCVGHSLIGHGRPRPATPV